MSIAVFILFQRMKFKRVGLLGSSEQRKTLRFRKHFLFEGGNKNILIPTKNSNLYKECKVKILKVTTNLEYKVQTNQQQKRKPSKHLQGDNTETLKSVNPSLMKIKS